MARRCWQPADKPTGEQADVADHTCASTRAVQGLGCRGHYVNRMEDLESALRRARDHPGPSLVCLRTDHDANLALPAELVSRFFEVYNGPAEPAG